MKKKIQQKDESKETIDVAVLVLAILSFFISFCNIIAIVLYFFSNKSASKKATIGLILAIISLVMSILIIIILILFFTGIISLGLLIG